jgi:hypothetical protein
VKLVGTGVHVWRCPQDLPPKTLDAVHASGGFEDDNCVRRHRCRRSVRPARDAAGAAGVEVTFESWKHGFHVWPVSVSAGLPESSAAIEHIAAVLKGQAILAKLR